MASFKIPDELNDKLWEHQRAAIKFAFPYLRDSAVSRVGLIRMPTGTGKTGVIAVLSVALPPPSWTLILTPWKNLCDQMMGDLSERFWTARGWLPPLKPNVERLYPSTLTSILKNKNKQLILADLSQLGG
jgi:superfamily II DNA or RNA helicase